MESQKLGQEIAQKPLIIEVTKTWLSVPFLKKKSSLIKKLDQFKQSTLIKQVLSHTSKLRRILPKLLQLK